MKHYMRILLSTAVCCLLLIIAAVPATAASEAATTTVYTSDARITVDTSYPSAFDAGMAEGSPLFSGTQAYRAHLLNYGRITFGGNWSVGLLASDGSYEKIARVLLMNGKQIDPSSQSVISGGWDISYGTTESFFLSALDRYLAGQRVTYFNTAGAGGLYLSPTYNYAAVQPSTTDTVIAYTYEASESVTATPYFSVFPTATASSNAYICLALDGRMIWPTENGALDSSSDWYAIYGKNATTVNAELASLSLSLSEGQKLEFCLRRDGSWASSSEYVSGLIFDPALTLTAKKPESEPTLSLPVIDGTTLTLNEAFAVNYYIAAPTGAEKVGLLYNGKFIEGTVQSDGTYKATVRGIAAKEIGDEVTVTPICTLDGEQVCGETDVRSPAAVLNRYVTFGGKVGDLAIATLNYATAAQNYFGYRTDSPANAALTDAQKASAPVGTYNGDIAFSGEANGVALSGMTLILEDTVAFKLMAKTEEGVDMTGLYAQISTDGFASYYQQRLTAETGNNWNCAAVFRGVMPTYWDKEYSFRIVDAAGNTVSQQIIYGVSIYAARVAANPNAPALLDPLTDAMLALYEAAAAYTA